MEPEEQIITFATYYDPMLAHIVRARFEDNGIPCFIADETMIGINPLYNNALGGIKLKIFMRDEQLCHQILAEPEPAFIKTDDGEEIFLPKTICPACGSANVRYCIAPVKGLDWLGFIISFVLMILPINTRRAWHCSNCGKYFE